MPRYRKWVKSFAFDASARSSLTLQGVRLHPARHRLEIERVGGGYPTMGEHVARTRVTKPAGCRRWSGFFASSKTTKDPAGVAITDVRYRLADESLDRFWDDAQGEWLPAGPGDWNTEQEIADHIETWPSQALGVVMRLETTSPAATPCIDEVRLLFDTDLVALDDYVVRSFGREMRERIRPISVFALRSTGQTQIDLGQLQTPYTITSVDVVYDNTADPDHMRPLVGWTYDADQKLLSLPAQPAGHELEVRFEWAPEVAMMQSQDFTEIAKIPAIVLDRIELTNQRMVRGGQPYVLNKGSGAGFTFGEGYQADITVPLRLITASKRDLHALQEEIARYFANNPLLRSRGQDEFYPISADTKSYRDDSTASQKELHSAGLQVKIFNAVFYPEDARPIMGVLDVRLSFEPDIDDVR